MTKACQKAGLSRDGGIWNRDPLNPTMLTSCRTVQGCEVLATRRRDPPVSVRPRIRIGVLVVEPLNAEQCEYPRVTCHDSRDRVDELRFLAGLEGSQEPRTSKKLLGFRSHVARSARTCLQGQLSDGHVHSP